MRDFDYLQFKDRTWDNEILSLIAKIHEFKATLKLYENQKPVELEKLVQIAKIQSTEASNKIEGIATTNIRLRKLFLDKTEMENELETYDGQLIINEDSVISDDFKIIIRGCSDADFYVDAITGEDSNNGSQTSPFKTIQKALDSIEGNKNIIYL